MNQRRKVQHVSVLADAEDLARIKWVMEYYGVNKTVAWQFLVKGKANPSPDQYAHIIEQINAGVDVFAN